MTTPKRKKFSTYPLTSSPLYRLSNKRKLAELLDIDKEQLNLASSSLSELYKKYVDGKTKRQIEEPHGLLLDVQRRILKLLSRLELPSYLHSAVKLRSYRTNAAAHLESANVFKIDIQKFYRAVKFKSVYLFFLNTLNCAPDIAVLLANLCTTESADDGRHLPTGSCLSPIVSFLANQQMFENIAELCKLNSSIFTLYVDDITISGANVNHEFMILVAGEIARAGYRFHKYKSYQARPATVTGLILDRGRIKLPHKRAKLIRSVEEALNVASDPTLKAKLLASLIGRLSEAEHIDTVYKSRRQAVMTKYAAEWRMITEDRTAKSQIRNTRRCIVRKRIWSPDDLVIKPSL